ncbi:MAG: OsmC family protein [Opitutales bacterium]
MVEVSITYTGDLHCQAVHGPSSSSLETDAPVDNRGRGERFSPTDLVATGLGTCMATIMGMQADVLGIDLTGARVRVTKEMTASPPRRIARLDVAIDIPGNLTDKQKAQLERAAETCPVHRSLHPEVAVPVTFNWGA